MEHGHRGMGQRIHLLQVYRRADNLDPFGAAESGQRAPHDQRNDVCRRRRRHHRRCRVFHRPDLADYARHGHDAHRHAGPHCHVDRADTSSHVRRSCGPGVPHGLRGHQGRGRELECLRVHFLHQGRRDAARDRHEHAGAHQPSPNHVQREFQSRRERADRVRLHCDRRYGGPRVAIGQRNELYRSGKPDGASGRRRDGLATGQRRSRLEFGLCPQRGAEYRLKRRLGDLRHRWSRGYAEQPDTDAYQHATPAFCQSDGRQQHGGCR